MASEMKVEGLSELVEKMRELPKNIARNALRAGVYAGAKVVQEDAKRRAPVYTGPISAGHPPAGTLKRSIIMKQIREESGPQQQVFYVMVRYGKKYRKQGKKGNLSQDAYYWRFVEFGTASQPAHPFMRPAFESTKMQAVEAIAAKLGERIEEAAAK